MPVLSIPRNPVLEISELGVDNKGKDSILASRYRLFTSSGRAAIAIGLRNLGISRGDAVLVPTYHCPTMVAPVVELGAVPIFYPITNTGSVDMTRLDLVTTPAVKAIIAAHYFGLPQPMRHLREYCDQRGIALIEDCAHAFFGESDGRPVGQWGDVAIASLTKFFCTPSGGLLVSESLPLDRVRLSPTSLGAEVRAALDILESATLAGRLGLFGRLLRQAYRFKRLVRAGRVSSPETDGASAGGDRTAAFGFDINAALRKAETVCRWLPAHTDYRFIVDRRRKIYLRLAGDLAGYAGFRPLVTSLGPKDAPYVFPLWVENPDEKYLALRRARIPVFRWDWLWPDTTHFPDDQGIAWSSGVIQIACHQSLSDDDVGRIVDCVVRTCRDGTPC